MTKKVLISWAAFDWANSVINTLVFTFVFSIYFSRSIYGDEVSGSAAWSFAMGCAGVVVALLSPVVGSIVDHMGPRKPLLKLFVIVCILLTSSLFLMKPDPVYITASLIIAACIVVSFELVQNIYSSTLPIVAPPEKLGFVSGIGWGAGYISGIVSLGIVLFLFVGFEQPTGLLNIATDEALNIRAAMIFAGAWFAVFAIPFFLFCPDAPKTQIAAGQAVSQGLSGLWDVVKSTRQVPGLIRFLVAAALYRDGLVTLFAVGGLYAAGTLNMTMSDVMIFAIAMNLAGGIGAIAMAHMDDRLGSQRTIVLCLTMLIMLGGVLLLLDGKMEFIAVACLLGLFVGPVQAASRAMLVRLSPPEKIGSYFGLYALTGKSVAFLGPFAFASVTAITDSQRLGMATILCFWAVGLFLVCSIRAGKKA